MRCRTLFSFVAMTIALTGCETSSPEALKKVATIPPNYRALTLEYFKKSLKDPYTVREAQITEPTPIFVGLVNGGTAPGVCVRLNSKNSFGAYTGLETHAVAFRGQNIAVGPVVFDTCSKATFRPFPELNGAG